MNLEKYVSKTILPHGIVLDEEEQVELYNFEQEYAAVLKETPKAAEIKAMQLFIKYRVSESLNVGIHWYCIEQDLTLRPLSTNQYISPTLVPMILERLLHIPTLSPISIRLNLLHNRVVYSDFDIFKMVFDTTLPNALFMILNDFLDNHEQADIGVLLFLFHKVKGASVWMQKTYLEMVEEREEEALAWLTKTNHSFEGLPLTWALRLHSFNIK